MQFHCDNQRLNPECRYIAMYSSIRNVESSYLWLYHSFIFVQIFSLSILFVITNLSLRILWNSSKFHPNMMRLIILFVAHINVHIFASFTFVVFQFDLLNVDDSDSIGHKVLLLASENRLYTLYLFLNIFIASMIQRLFASIFIADYETKQRHSIGRMLVFITIVCSHLKAIDSTFGIFFTSLLWENPRIWSSVVPGIVSHLLSKLIVVRNRSVLRSIERHPHNSYTLSIKYQLVENIRTNKLLLRWGSCSVLFALPACFVLLKRNRYPVNSSEASLWGSCFDLVLTLAILASIIFLMCSQSTWRASLCSKFRLDRYFCGNNVAVSTICDNHTASDMYFEQFGKAWQYDKKDREQNQMGFLHCFIVLNKTECRIIPLFANYSDISPGFSTFSYFALQLIEMLSNLYSITVISLSFSHIFKSKIFHTNFISILICFYGHYYLFAFTRLVLSIYQNGLITLGDSSSYSHKTLMFFSVLRFYELFFGVYSSIALTIERVCATLLISDYEVINRRYISVILVSFAVFMGHLLAYFTTHGIVGNLITSSFIMIGFTMVTVSLFLLISLIIQLRNAKYEKILEESNDVYALSMKFQLRENFRAFQLLRRVSLISGITALCMCVDIYFMIIYEFDKNLSSLLGAIFDTMQACGFTVFVSCGVFSQPSWRSSFAKKIGFRRGPCTSGRETKVHPIDYARMSDIYFNELGDAWERKFKNSEITKSNNRD